MRMFGDLAPTRKASARPCTGAPANRAVTPVPDGRAPRVAATPTRPAVRAGSFLRSRRNEPTRTEDEMKTQGTTFTKTATTTEAAAPLLRELTYRYQSKRDRDGKTIRLGAVMQNPRSVAAM